MKRAASLEPEEPPLGVIAIDASALDAFESEDDPRVAPTPTPSVGQVPQVTAVAQEATFANVAPVAQVTPGAQVTPVPDVAPVAHVPPVGHVTPAANVAPVAHVTPAAQVTPGAQVTPAPDVARVAHVAPVAHTAPPAPVVRVARVAPPAHVASVADLARVAHVPSLAGVPAGRRRDSWRAWPVLLIVTALGIGIAGGRWANSTRSVGSSAPEAVAVPVTPDSDAERVRVEPSTTTPPDAPAPVTAQEPLVSRQAITAAPPLSEPVRPNLATVERIARETPSSNAVSAAPPSRTVTTAAPAGRGERPATETRPRVAVREEAARTPVTPAAIVPTAPPPAAATTSTATAGAASAVAAPAPPPESVRAPSPAPAVPTPSSSVAPPAASVAPPAASAAPSAASAAPPAVSAAPAAGGSAPAAPPGGGPPPSAPAPAPTGAAPARDIQLVLSRYRSAFGSLSAAAVTEVWPSVDAGALSRAFRGIEEQAIAFDNCSISATDVTATASCTGSIRYVPRVGSRNPRSESRTWRFSLRRVADRWLIDRVETR